MKVILLAPLPGYSHFEGEVINLPPKVAEEAINNKLAEPFAGKSKPEKTQAEEPITGDNTEKPAKPAKPAKGSSKNK